MKKIAMLLLLVAAFPAFAAAAEVKNLKVGQEGDKAVAVYDLVGVTGERETEVSVAIIIDGRRRVSDQLRLSGDFGKDVTVGPGKRIVWDAKTDLPLNFDGELSWEVTASGKGKVPRGWIGVVFQAITPELAQSFGIEGDKGALVTEVVKDSPADKAGIKSGDIILEFDDRQIHEIKDLPRLVAATPVGKTVNIKILRDGAKIGLALTVERLKESGSGETSAAPDRLGLTVSELTGELAAKLGLREAKGIVVVEVKTGGIAEGAKIARGDVVTEINGARVTSVLDYETTVAAHKNGAIMRLLLRRGGNSFFVAIKVD